MAGYIGRQPLSEVVQSRAKYTATANQTTFSFTYQPGFIDVYLNGIKLEDTIDYTATNGADIVLTSGATVGQVLEAVGLSTFSLVNGKINYSAGQAPAVTNDSSEGYRIGSMWIDTTNDEVYRCTDDVVGAALWIGTTLEITDLGSLATVTPTGTANTTTFLRGDNTWQVVNTTPSITETNGSVGIGNTTPNSYPGNWNDLVVGSTGPAGGRKGIIIASGSGPTDTGTLSFADGTSSSDTAGFVQYLHSTDTLYLGANNQSVMTLDSTGINVTGSVTCDGATIDGNIVHKGSSPDHYYETGSTHYNFRVATQESTDAGYVISSGTQSSNAVTDTYTPRLTIKGDTGNVGIGTSSPTAKLDINNSTGADLGWDSGLKIERASGQIGKIVTDSEGMKYRTFASGSAHHFRNSSNATTMKIDSTGNVGISTSSPSEKLEVAGKVKATDFIGDGLYSTGVMHWHFGNARQRIGGGTENGGTVNADHNGNGSGQILGSLSGFNRNSATTTGFEHLGYVRDNIASSADRSTFETELMNALQGVTRYPSYSRGTGGPSHAWRMHIDTTSNPGTWGYYPSSPSGNHPYINPVAWGGMFRITQTNTGNGNGAYNWGGLLSRYDTSQMGEWQHLNYDYGYSTTSNTNSYTYAASGIINGFTGYIDFFLPYMVSGHLQSKIDNGLACGLFMENKANVR